MLNTPPAIDEGIWVAHGFLEERSFVVADPDGGFTKKLYNFSGFGGPDETTRIGLYDYFDFPVTNPTARHEPASWGGMSGGGCGRLS
jgi:hypothetical protein